MAEQRVRITVNPSVFGGKPCIRGLRFPVSRLLGALAAGQSEAEILRQHPDLEAEDIRAVLGFAARLAADGITPVGGACTTREAADSTVQGDDAGG